MRDHTRSALDALENEITHTGSLIAVLDTLMNEHPGAELNDIHTIVYALQRQQEILSASLSACRGVQA